jgi:hypothetical protein
VCNFDSHLPSQYSSFVYLPPTTAPGKTWLGPARPDRVGLEVETRLDPHFSLLRSLLENYSSQTMHTAPAHVCGYICANIRINEDYTHERPFGMLATVFL